MCLRSQGSNWLFPPLKTRLELLVRYRRSVFGLCYTLNGLFANCSGNLTQQKNIVSLGKCNLNSKQTSKDAFGKKKKAIQQLLENAWKAMKSRTLLCFETVLKTKKE